MKLTSLAFIFILFSGIITQAEEIIAKEDKKEIESVGLIELELSADPDASYKQRRSFWSKRFSVTYEAMVPDSFVSLIDGTKYTALFSTNHIPILSINYGYQLNSVIGAFYLEVGFGSGTISNSSGTTGDQLSLSKTSLNLGLFLDNVFQNPYLIPFISMQALVFNWREHSSVPTTTREDQTGITFGYTFGASIQIDRFDKKTSGRAYVEHGLRNTFLDIYGTIYQQSQLLTDPNFSTSTNIAAALRFEF